MSGVELALAIAPLIIAGAETYREMWETSRTSTRQYVKHEKHIDFLRDLLYEMRILQLLLRSLVSELPRLTSEQKNALVEHDQECWHSQVVTDALNERLCGAEDAFRETLAMLLKTLESLIRHKSTELDDTGTSQPSTVFTKLEQLRSNPQLASSRRERFVNRFRFATNEKSRAYAMHKILQCNERLQKLLEQASRAPTSIKKSSRRTGPPIDKCRELINALHDKMSTCWACECENPHEAKLCLLRSFSTPENKSTITSLDMLISTVPGDADRGPMWQESHVRIVAEQKSDSHTPTVRFEVNGAVVEPQTPRDPRRSPVVSLCSLLREQADKSVSIGIDYEDGTLWRTRSRRKSLSVSKPELVTPLGNLLNTPEWQMSLRRKRTLAVVVAHAVLNFCEGPWLQRHWDKQNISFFKDPSSENEFDLARPYLSTMFPKSALTDGVEDNAGADLFSLHQSPPILALGVLLLELELCKPIESQYSKEDLVDGKPNHNTNLTAAQRLLTERVDNLYEGYRSAIEACLKCDFMSEEDLLSLESGMFREKIYDRIVAPLEDELEHCSGLTPDRLVEIEAH